MAKVLGVFLTLVVGVFLALPVGAVAPDNFQWVNYTNGLVGNDIVGVVVDPTNSSNIFALTKTLGIFRSTNGGTSWTAVAGSGLPTNKSVAWSHLLGNLLTIDPANPATLYVNFNGKPYRTTDSGANWTEINSGIDICAPDYQIAAVIVDPTDSNHIFAAHIATGCGGGLYESTNKGDSWTRIQVSGGANDMFPLAVDPSDLSKMYVSTVHEEDFRSSDGGVSWTTMSFPSPYSGSDGQDIAIHPTNHQVFVAMASGMLTSTDYGANWSAVADLAGENVRAVKFAPSDSTVAYALTANGKIYRSADSGTSWTVQSTNSQSWNSLAIANSDSGLLYLGSLSSGMYKSANSGVAVTAINTGMPVSIQINALNGAKNNPGVYYLISSGGVVFRSSDSGKGWVKKGTVPDSFASFNYNLKVDPNDSETLYAGGQSLYKSTDGGANWSVVLAPPDGVTNLIPRDTVYIDPTDSLKVSLISYGAGRLYRSTNGGTSWSWLAYPGTGVAERLRVDPTNSQKMYVPGSFVWKTTDGGSNWTQTTGYIYSDSSSDNNDLAIDPVSPNIFYLVGGYVVYRSTDNGATIQPKFAPGFANTFVRVLIDATDHNKIYAFGTQSWFVSTGQGNDWTEMPHTNYPLTPKFSMAQGTDASSSSLFVSADFQGDPGGAKVYENYIPKFDKSTFGVANHDASASGYRSGDTLDFTFTLKNTGPAQGTGPTVRIVLPSQITYVSGSAKVDDTVIANPMSGSTMAVTGNKSLLENESFVLTFQATVNSGVSGTVVIDPKVTSGEDTSGTTIADLTINVAGGGGTSSNNSSNGSSSTTSSCGDGAPSKAPDLFQVDTTETTATLYFVPAGDPNSYYYFAYGKTKAALDYGASVTLAESTGVMKYLIEKLSPESTYYFRVRGGNGCKPGDWSKTMVAKTNGGLVLPMPSVATTTPAPVPAVVVPEPVVIEPPKNPAPPKTCILWNWICW